MITVIVYLMIALGIMLAFAPALFCARAADRASVMFPSILLCSMFGAFSTGPLTAVVVHAQGATGAGPVFGAYFVAWASPDGLS